MADQGVASRHGPRVLCSLLLLPALPEPRSQSTQSVTYNRRDGQPCGPQARPRARLLNEHRTSPRRRFLEEIMFESVHADPP